MSSPRARKGFRGEQALDAFRLRDTCRTRGLRAPVTPGGPCLSPDVADEGSRRATSPDVRGCCPNLLVKGLSNLSYRSSFDIDHVRI